MTSKLRIGVLISGRGSNMLAIAEACQKGQLTGEVEVVISDNPEAPGLAKAQNLGLKTASFSPKSFQNKSDYEAKLVDVLQENSVDLVVLAGYMRLVSLTLLQAFEGRIINIHPSLLPAFKGLHAQKQAFDYGVKVAGCSVHFVDDSLDGGPIIKQKVVPVLDSDDLESLTQRILGEEHRLLIESIELIAQQQITLNGRRVVIKES